MNPQEFLAALWGENPPGMLNIWMLPDQKSSWYPDLEKVNRDMQQHLHEEVYTGVALARKEGTRFNTRSRVKEVDAAAIPGVWADIDVFHPSEKVHKEKSLPSTVEQAQETMAKLPHSPTLIVDSGHGLQYWWLLEEPWVFKDQGEWEQARRLTQWWHRITRELFDAMGWTTDSVFDLSRIMRLPGTFNNKIPEERKEVTVIKADGPRYSLNQFMELVPENFAASAPAPEDRRGRRGRASQQAASTTSSGLVLDPDAEPKPVRLQALLKADVRFMLTWRHHRPDLKDQSPSSYNMSLADTAVRADWPDQEVINLMICWRRIHGCDLKLRERYYELTLAKAKHSRAGDSRAGDSRANGASGSNAQAGPSAEGAPPDLASLLRRVKVGIHDCKDPDPEVFRLIHEIGLLASAWSSDEAGPGQRAAAQIKAHYDVYADRGDVPTLEALAAAVKSAMSPATQVPLLVDRVVKALLGNEKSSEPLSELLGMLRRQSALEGNRARLIDLVEAGTLPVPQSLLRAKGMPGSVLDVGEVMVLSGMGGAGKSTITLGWALDMALLGPGNRGQVGGVFDGEGGTVMMVSYEEQAAVMGDKASVLVKHLDEGDPNGRYHAARKRVLHLGIRNPLFGPDPYTPSYNSRPTVLEGFDEVVEAAEKIRPILIVIDPALCAFAADANNPSMVSEFLLVIRDLAVRFTDGVVLVTHNTKAARGSGGRRGQDGADPGQVLGAGAWTDRSRSALTLTTDSKGCPQLTIAKANRGPQRIYIGLDPVLDDKKRLLGYKVGDQATWKRLDQQSDGGAGRGSGPETGNSDDKPKTKRLFED